MPKEADCPTLYAFPAAVAVGPPSFLSTAETDRFLLLFRRRRRTYRNYGACLSLFLGCSSSHKNREAKCGEKTMAPFSRFVPTLGFGVFRFVFGSLDLWAYTPKSPIPSLLSLLPFKMKYCRRLWISEAAGSFLPPFRSRLKMTSTLLAPRRRSFPTPSDLRTV